MADAAAMRRLLLAACAVGLAAACSTPDSFTCTSRMSTRQRKMVAVSAGDSSRLFCSGARYAFTTALSFFT